MRNIVISQPMFFPWVGIFEQIRLAEIYVHYDDVQFSKGSFVNRVQIKTSQGIKWLTVPLEKLKLGIKIDEAMIDNKQDWKRRHLVFLEQAYRTAPFKEDMLHIISSVYEKPHRTIAELSMDSIEAVCRYYGLDREMTIIRSSTLNVSGESSERVLDIVKKCDGSKYITGHGAQHYLNHSLFEANDIDVRYMVYQKRPYQQLHGEFTPYVSVLDLIANTGVEGIGNINSGTISWKEFMNGSDRTI